MYYPSSPFIHAGTVTLSKVRANINLRFMETVELLPHVRVTILWETSATEFRSGFIFAPKWTGSQFNVSDNSQVPVDIYL